MAGKPFRLRLLAPPAGLALGGRGRHGGGRGLPAARRFDGGHGLRCRSRSRSRCRCRWRSHICRSGCHRCSVLAGGILLPLRTRATVFTPATVTVAAPAVTAGTAALAALFRGGLGRLALAVFRTGGRLRGVFRVVLFIHATGEGILRCAVVGSLLRTRLLVVAVPSAAAATAAAAALAAFGPVATIGLLLALLARILVIAIGFGLRPHPSPRVRASPLPLRPRRRNRSGQEPR